MRLEHALFLAAVIAFTLTISLSFWIDRFGRGLSLLGSFFVFLLLTLALTYLFLVVPAARMTVIIIWIIVVVISLLVNLISKN